MEFEKVHDTAILVFANSAQHELQYKPMANGAQFFEALTERTLKLVRETKIPFFHFTEKQQNGNAFGERFVNSLQSVFDKGYKNVISIGNDTPHLSVKHLLDARDRLEAKKFVLGPSADGGFYLMGLHRSNFDATEFLKLPWQSSGLNKALLELVSDQGKGVVSLKTLFDLDTVRDLKLFANRFKNVGKHLLVLVLELIRPKDPLLCPISCSGISTQYHSNFFNKGSPVLA